MQQKVEEKDGSLIKEGGHGVVGSGAFHSEGLHLLLCGFAYLLQAVVRSLPLVDLHHLRYLLQPLLLGAQGLQHDRQLSALYQGKRNAHGYFQGICFLRVYTIVIKCYTYKPVHLLSVYTLKLKLKGSANCSPVSAFLSFWLRLPRRCCCRRFSSCASSYSSSSFPSSFPGASRRPNTAHQTLISLKTYPGSNGAGARVI